MNFQIKRVYETPTAEDGKRILIDRLWPRGLSKEKAKVDLWLKEIAPTTELRQWFAHDPNKWDTFKNRYIDELKKNSELVSQLAEQVKKEKVTLVYGAKDEEHNDAVVLKAYIEKRNRVGV